MLWPCNLAIIRHVTDLRTKPHTETCQKSSLQDAACISCLLKQLISYQGSMTISHLHLSSSGRQVNSRAPDNSVSKPCIPCRLVGTPAWRLWKRPGLVKRWVLWGKNSRPVLDLIIRPAITELCRKRQPPLPCCRHVPSEQDLGLGVRFPCLNDLQVMTLSRRQNRQPVSCTSLLCQPQV